jgi:hypothetical protein
MTDSGNAASFGVGLTQQAGSPAPARKSQSCTAGPNFGAQPRFNAAPQYVIAMYK